MQRNALLVLVAALIGLGLWIALSPPIGSLQQPAAAGGSTTTDGTNPARRAGDATRIGTEADRREPQRASAGPLADDTARPGLCRLTVEAVWPDATPAVGVGVTVRTLSSDGSRVAGRARTDEKGVVVFADLVAREVLLYSDRNDYQRVDLTPGEQTHRFELKGGVAVHGTVVDSEGRPVAGATVVLQTRQTSWAGAHDVATTAADGTFALERIPQGPSLGAFARGHAPSPLLDLDLVDMEDPPVEVRLELGERGGSVAGLVVDASGSPVEGARVLVGAQVPHLDHRRNDETVEQWSPRSTETDAEGRFELFGLPIGEAPLDVLRAGFGIARQTITIAAGEQASVRVTLLREARVLGIVTDGAGQPLENATIRIYDREPRTPFLAGGQIDFDLNFGYRGAVTDASGRYEVTGVTPGTAWAFAQEDGRRRRMQGKSVSYVRTELEIAPGEEQEWSPQIVAGPTIEGVVLYSDGQPMPGVFITVKHELSDFEAVQTNSYEDATFAFTCLEPGTYTVSVQLWDAPKGTARPELQGVAPDTGRLEIRAPYPKPVEQEPGVVMGRVLDTGKRVEAWSAVRVEFHSDEGWFRTDGEVVDGAFRFDKVQPCRFRILLAHGDTPIAQSEWFGLEPAATVDIGTLTTMQGGTLHLVIERPEGAEGLAPRIFTKPEGFVRSTRIEPGTKREWTEANLTPGVHTISAYADGMVPLETEVTVAPGATAHVILRLVAGRRCRASFWFPDDHGATSYRYRFVAADGTVAHQYESELGTRSTSPLVVSRNLPPGTWTLEFSTDNGLTASVPFTVEDATGEAIETRVDLER